MARKRNTEEAKRLETLFKRIWDHTEGEHFTVSEIMLYADDQLFPQYKGMTDFYKARSLGKIFSVISSKQYAGFKLVRQGIKRPAIYKLWDMRSGNGKKKLAKEKVVKKKAAPVPEAPEPCQVPVTKTLRGSYERAATLFFLEQGYPRIVAESRANEIIKLAVALDRAQES